MTVGRALMLSLAAVALGFFLALGARGGLIAGEILIPAPGEPPMPSYICYGSPALSKPLCKAITAEQLQLVLSNADVVE